MSSTPINKVNNNEASTAKRRLFEESDDEDFNQMVASVLKMQQERKQQQLHQEPKVKRCKEEPLTIEVDEEEDDPAVVDKLNSLGGKSIFLFFKSIITNLLLFNVCRSSRC